MSGKPGPRCDSSSTVLPLRVGRPAGNRLKEGDPLKAEVQQVDQTHAEGSEQVKGLTNKMTPCRLKKKKPF